MKVIILGNRSKSHRAGNRSSITAAATLPSRSTMTATRLIMINCNPETVSTDYDTSDRLYFRALTF